MLQNQELERQKEYERRLKQAKTREEFKKANDDLQIYLAELKKKEQAEEAKISEYARACTPPQSFAACGRSVPSGSA